MLCSRLYADTLALLFEPPVTLCLLGFEVHHLAAVVPPARQAHVVRQMKRLAMRTHRKRPLFERLMAPVLTDLRAVMSHSDDHIVRGL